MKKGNYEETLISAINQGNLYMIKKCIENSVDVNTRDHMGNTVLMLASRLGNIKAVRLLLKHKVDANICDGEYGLTALMLAAKHGHKEIVKLLLEYQPYENDWIFSEHNKYDGIVDIESKDFNGWNALTWATKTKHDEIAFILREKGATKDYEEIIIFCVGFVCFVAPCLGCWIVSLISLIVLFCLYIQWKW